ncbi:hypothetical protein Voja6_00169 [Pseudomonas phage vB_PpuM-Voja-6]
MPRFYHVSEKDIGKHVTLKAKVPSGRNHDECAETLRVCFSPTVWQCLGARIGAADIGSVVREAVYQTRKADRKLGKINNPAVYFTDKKLFKPKAVSDFAKTKEHWSKVDIEVERAGFVDIKTLMTTGRIEITNRRQSSVKEDFYAGWSQGLQRGNPVSWFETPPYEPLTSARQNIKKY